MNSAQTTVLWRSPVSVAPLARTARALIRGRRSRARDNDRKQLLPVLAQIAANLDQNPEKVSADTNYFSEPSVIDESVNERR